MAISIEMFKDAKRTKEFQAGEIIFEAGMPGDFMYVVLEGEVEIFADDKVFNKVPVGEIFGEMALIDNSPRSASARVAVPTKLALVNRFDFTFYVQHSPFFALDIMEIMANRLRSNMDR
jgi:CRP/FNR family transcriptional regulator, cyclic AMP receptor protein